jgi:hypothetical protein
LAGPIRATIAGYVPVPGTKLADVVASFRKSTAAGCIARSGLTLAEPWVYLVALPPFVDNLAVFDPEPLLA